MWSSSCDRPRSGEVCSPVAVARGGHLRRVEQHPFGCARPPSARAVTAAEIPGPHHLHRAVGARVGRCLVEPAGQVNAITLTFRARVVRSRLAHARSVEVTRVELGDLGVGTARPVEVRAGSVLRACATTVGSMEYPTGSPTRWWAPDIGCTEARRVERAVPMTPQDRPIGTMPADRAIHSVLLCLGTSAMRQDCRRCTSPRERGDGHGYTGVLAPTKIDLAGRPAPTSIRHPRPRNGPRSPPCWGMKGLPHRHFGPVFATLCAARVAEAKAGQDPRRAVMAAEFVVR